MEEIIEVYSKDRQKINQKIRNVDYLDNNEFALVTNVWIVTNDNKIILTKRVPSKKWPNAFECTGGYAQLNEDSKEASIREVKEEIGIDIKKENLILLKSNYFTNQIVDTYFYKLDENNQKIVLDQNEVSKIIFVDFKQLFYMWKLGKIAFPISLRLNSYIKEFYELYLLSCEKQKAMD